MIAALVRSGASLETPTTSQWWPEDAAIPEGTTPKSLLDDGLRDALGEDGIDVIAEDEEFQRLAEAIVEELPAWVSRVSSFR